ncbi:MAG: sulfurtransferase, partial [Candidatus Melainabacteria bacterium]|nr:sulfurtransferase [Candidatus Melainabacteria bacterium]
VNIAAYKFVGIPEPAQWQPVIKERCDQLHLKGTVLLATEGINLFLAGKREKIEEFLQFLQNDPIFGARFAVLDIKESFSSNQPFKKMVVRIANEIITMRHPMIRPEDSRAPHVDAATLRKWLDQGHDDEGRELVLLDTRNDFEVEMGTFENALNLNIEKFSDFPDAIASTMRVESSLKQKTIVSFCTGGIRCEKAALYLQEKGHPKVFQLDGGILRYFEDVGGAHWHGECFVFDERVSLDPGLKESGKTLADRKDGKPKQ